MSVSLGELVGTITHPKVPSNVEPISHEQFDGFGNVQNATWMRTDENANFPRDGWVLKSLHKAHCYCWIYFPSCAYSALPTILWSALSFRCRETVETTHVRHRPFQAAWMISPTFRVADWI